MPGSNTQDFAAFSPLPLAIDTGAAAQTRPGTPAPSCAVRGNVLDLERIWLNSDNAGAPWLPRPSHLKVRWSKQDWLPYWYGLTATEACQLHWFRVGVAAWVRLRQSESRLHWLHWQAPSWGSGASAYRTAPSSGSIPRCEHGYGCEEALAGSMTLVPPQPAYTRLLLRAGLSLRRPRYDTPTPTPTSTPTPGSQSPAIAPTTVQPLPVAVPLKVRWPRGETGSQLSTFMAQALAAEGITAWPCPVPQSASVGYAAQRGRGRAARSYVAAVAVASAPWFGGLPSQVESQPQPSACRGFEPSHCPSPNREILQPSARGQSWIETETEEIWHVAQAIAKLDYYLFA